MVLIACFVFLTLCRSAGEKLSHGRGYCCGGHLMAIALSHGVVEAVCGCQALGGQGRRARIGCQLLGSGCCSCSGCLSLLELLLLVDQSSQFLLRQYDGNGGGLLTVLSRVSFI